MDDAHERFVRGEYTRSSRKRVALQHSLTCVFRKHLNYTTCRVSTGHDIPLEATAEILQRRTKLVAYQFVWTPDTEGLGISRNVLNNNQ